MRYSTVRDETVGLVAVRLVAVRLVIVGLVEETRVTQKPKQKTQS